MSEGRGCEEARAPRRNNISAAPQQQELFDPSCWLYFKKYSRIYRFIHFQYIYPAVTINGQDGRGLLGPDQCALGVGSYAISQFNFVERLLVQAGIPSFSFKFCRFTGACVFLSLFAVFVVAVH